MYTSGCDLLREFGYKQAFKKSAFIGRSVDIPVIIWYLRRVINGVTYLRPYLYFLKVMFVITLFELLKVQFKSKLMARGDKFKKLIPIIKQANKRN